MLCWKCCNILKQAESFSVIICRVCRLEGELDPNADMSRQRLTKRTVYLVDGKKGMKATNIQIGETKVQWGKQKTKHVGKNTMRWHDETH